MNTALKEIHNPGMSERAWDNFHRLLLQANKKYGLEIATDRMKGEKKSG